MNHRIPCNAVLVLALSLAACSDDPAGPAERPVARVEVSPDSAVLSVGDTLRLSARARAADGTPLDQPVAWQSEDPALAGVRQASGGAVVEAKAPGTVRIRASAGGVEGSVRVRVVAALPRVAAVKILPLNPVMHPGEWLLLEAIALAADSTTMIAGRLVAWNSGDTAAVSVARYQQTEYGELRAHAAGSVLIRAEIDGVRAEVRVTVLPRPATVARIELAPADTTVDAGAQFSLRATLYTADNRVVAGRSPTWSSQSATVASVDGTGTVTARQSGLAVIRAQVDGVVGEARVQVRPPESPVGFVRVLPRTRAVWTGLTYAYGPDVRVLSPGGQPLTGRPVTWSVQDSSIASIDSTGTVRGKRPGQTRVRATSGGVSGEATLVVYDPPGDDAAYDLTFDWWDGILRLPPQVGTQQYTDSMGTVHQVALFPARGTLTFAKSGTTQTYQRVLRLEGWTTLDGRAVKVVERELVDRGIVGLIVGGETGYELVSSTTPGLRHQAVGTGNAGHLLMREAVGSASLQGYLYRLRP